MSVIPALWDFTVTGEQVCFIEAASEAVAKASVTTTVRMGSCLSSNIPQSGCDTCLLDLCTEHIYGIVLYIINDKCTFLLTQSNR